MADLNIYHGDLFDLRPDCLVCSANVFLTLSGGVGGELLRRYGPTVQTPLESYLKARGRPFTDRGDVVSTQPEGTPYRLVLHAVAVDGMYDSSPAVVANVVATALRMAADAGCRTVAFPALATGYGHLTFEQFLAGWCAGIRYVPALLTTVTLAVRDHDHAQAARKQLAFVKASDPSMNTPTQHTPPVPRP